MAISDIIAVSISVQDASPSVANFGVPMIFAAHGNFVGGKLYNTGPSGLSAMVTDGFTVNDRAYHMAQDLSNQNPGTDQFYVYDRATGGNSQAIDMTIVNATEGFVYTFEVRASGQATTTAINYTVLAAATTTTVATAVAALINAATGVTASSAVAVISITPTTADTFVYLDGLPNTSALTIADTSSDAGIATDLAQALVDFGDSFYGVLIDSFSEAEIQAAAAWALSNNKILGGDCADTDILTSSSTDVASDLQTASNTNAYVCFTRNMSASKAAGLMARQFSQDPGTSSWYFKTLVGVSADNITATEFAFGKGKDAMMYINDKGVAHTSVGKAASGRALETTRAIAQMQDLIEARVIGVFANNEKISFTNGDIALLRAEVSGVLELFETRNFIKPAGDPDGDGWFVTTTPLASVSAVDKAAGLYDGIDFHAVLSGEVEKVTVTGTITL